MDLESTRSNNTLENSRLLGEDKRNAAETNSAMAETDLKKMEMGQVKAAIDLQKQLDNPELKPEERKQIENKLYAIQGKPQQKYQLTTRKTADAQGNVTETPYMIDAEGNAVEIGGESGQAGSTVQAPISALDALRKNPKLAGEFKAKYGYLPPGF